MLLGIDIGTSSVKAMLLDEENGRSYVAAREYDVVIPKKGFAEQDPETWWELLKEVLSELKYKDGNGFEKISSIGFSGQMHGLVMVDKDGRPVRNAILWLDQRSEKQLDEIKEQVSFQEMVSTTHNRPFTGFAFPSLLWVKENEPEVYDRCYKIMHPKDFIRLRLTGRFGSDMSDASSSSGFNVGGRDWAWDIMRRMGIDEDKLPECHEATETAGAVTAEAAKETGLKEGVTVVFGSGDQPAQSIGNGAVKEGIVISNIGTGGQIATYSAKDACDRYLRTHTFCHGIGKAYTIFGASLCSGLSLKWLKNNVVGAESYDVMSKMADEVPAGSEGLIYLPYLTGERTPHMNPKAKGIFFGMSLAHDRRHFARAVMEGVTFGLKDSLEIFNEMGLSVDRIIASGGGAKSSVWLQMQADIFEKEVIVCKVKEQACLGACIMAGIGEGVFADAEEAADKLVEFDDRVYTPSPETARKYRAAYSVFKKIYAANKELFEIEY